MNRWETPDDDMVVVVKASAVEEALRRIDAGEDRDKVFTDIAQREVQQDDLIEFANAFRAAAQKPQVLKAADAHLPAFKAAVQYAFLRGRQAIRAAGRTVGQNPDRAAEVARGAVETALAKVLGSAVLNVAVAGGKAGMAGLRRMAAAEAFRGLDRPVVSYRFDETNPKAVEWARQHAAELAVDLSKTTERDIRAAVADALENGEDPYDRILEAVGDEARAEMIARTETMMAASEGQRMAWEQAVDDGQLDPNATRVWITTPGCCDLCEALEGETATLSGSYPSPGEDGPPLHPNCRCTEGIQG